MSNTKLEKKGGARQGAGRPKGEGGKLVYVPTSLVAFFEGIINAYKTNQRKLEEKEGR